MKKNIFTISVLINTMLYLLGCDNNNNIVSDSEQNKKGKKEIVEENIFDAKKKELSCVVYDSLMKVPNTIEKFGSAKQAQQCLDVWNYETKPLLDSLLNTRQVDKLHQEVIVTSRTIIEKYVSDIKKTLNVYKLWTVFPKDILNLIEPYGVDLDSYEYFLQEELFVKKLLNESKFSDLGIVLQTKVKNIVMENYRNMVTELRQNRIDIAKKYAKYYPMLDVDANIPNEYKDLFVRKDPAIEYVNGDAVYDYRYSKDIGPGIVIFRTVNVYSSNLNPEFFDVSDAEFVLKNIEKGKWQVVKNLKNGAVEYSEVFSDRSEYKTWSCVCTKDVSRKIENRFEIKGKRGSGTHIFVKECPFALGAQKEDTVMFEPKRMAQLKNKEKEMQRLDSLLLEYKDHASVLAKKIATEKLKLDK